jgi:hypothetical protein
MVWGGVLLFILGSNLGGVGPERGLWGGGRRGGVRSGLGAARTILRFHFISARPSKQPLIVRIFLKVYGAWLLFFVPARNIYKRHHKCASASRWACRKKEDAQIRRACGWKWTLWRGGKKCSDCHRVVAYSY